MLAAHLPHPTVYLTEHLTFERVHLFEDRQASVEAGYDTLSPFFADPEAGAGRIDHAFGDNVDVDEAAFGESGTIGSEEFTVALFREVDTVARMFQGERVLRAETFCANPFRGAKVEKKFYCIKFLLRKCLNVLIRE